MSSSTRTQRPGDFTVKSTLTFGDDVKNLKKSIRSENYKKQNRLLISQ